jgi:hypothetical protein
MEDIDCFQTEACNDPPMESAKPSPNGAEKPVSIESHIAYCTKLLKQRETACRALLLKAMDDGKKDEVLSEVSNLRKRSATYAAMKTELREKKIDDVPRLPEEERTSILEGNRDLRNKIRGLYKTKKGSVDDDFKQLTTEIASAYAEAVALAKRVLPGLEKMLSAANGKTTPAQATDDKELQLAE